MPRALKPRGITKEFSPKLQCYSILTIALPDTHHGVTKSTRATVNEIDDRGSHFWLSLFWAEALAAQTDDAELASAFAPVAEELRANAEQIDSELLAAQGSAADLGGYYWPDEEKTTAVMRPSATFNTIIDALKK